MTRQPPHRRRRTAADPFDRAQLAPLRPAEFTTLLRYVDPVLGVELTVHANTRRGYAQVTLAQPATGDILAVRVRDACLDALIDALTAARDLGRRDTPGSTA